MLPSFRFMFRVHAILNFPYRSLGRRLHFRLCQPAVPSLAGFWQRALDSFVLLDLNAGLVKVFTSIPKPNLVNSLSLCFLVLCYLLVIDCSVFNSYYLKSSSEYHLGRCWGLPCFTCYLLK